MLQQVRDTRREAGASASDHARDTRELSPQRLHAVAFGESGEVTEDVSFHLLAVKYGSI